MGNKIKRTKLIGCFKCGKRTPLYMVKDTVWLQAWPDYARARRLNPEIFLDLCLTCLSNALERELIIDDFTNAPVNDGIRLGFEIGKRIRENEST